MANIIASAVVLQFSQVSSVCNRRTGILLLRTAKGIYKTQQTNREDVQWK